VTARGRLAARAFMLAAPATGAVVGLGWPDDRLLGGAAWLLVLATSLAGWGRWVARAARLDVDLGLRLAWGCAAYLAVGGWLMMLGVLSAPVQLALLGVGAVGYGWHVVTAAPPDVGATWHALRDRPALALYGLIALAVAIDVLHGIANRQVNVNDDDLAYTALVRRLLQIGDLDERFSFRRISAYGGQTILASLGAVRGTLANPYLVDHGLFRLITFALVIGLARGRAAIDHALVAALLLVLAVLPDTSINTGSHWSGLALCLALYRTATLEDTTRRWVMVALVAAAAASLRQTNLFIAGVFVLATLAWSPQPFARRDRWTALALGFAVGLLPYAIAAWRTCGTPLYPLWPGNFNPDIQLGATGSLWRELQFFGKVAVEPTPIRVMLPLALVLFAIRDRRPGAPLTALAVACTLGFVELVHAFSLSDPPNLWRYAFGFMTAWTVVAIVEPSHQPDAAVTTPALARLIALVALLTQLAITAPSMISSYANLARDLDGAHRGPAAEEIAAPRALYAELQAATPPGATLAVLLDQPFLLDYRRNDIINVDTPGYVSPAPGWPAFAGPEALATYLRGQGIRYYAFVRGDRSRYFYRRDYWVLRTLFDSELWQVIGAHTVDAVETSAALATTRAILFERDGMVLLDLESRR